MSVGYRPVQWNKNKWVYDAILVAFVFAYIVTFIQIGPDLLDVRSADRPILRMRAFGSCAFILLTVILCIGPLARLDRRFLPLLYNRRHFGVMMFATALAHAYFVKQWYYAFSPTTDPYVAILGANTAFASWYGFPFEIFGVLALVILFFMAATSHDFWLSFLGAPVWKALHMGVYLAYALVILHTAFGLLQGEPHPFYVILIGGSFLLVSSLHLIAGLHEVGLDRKGGEPGTEAGKSWLKVCRVSEIPLNRARVTQTTDGERVAVFRYENKVSAISNVCAHQNGPLGEGKVVDGCITCPWHGFQYRMIDGRSPPPFTEKVATYRVMLIEDVVFVDTEALPAGTPVAPAIIPNALLPEAQ